MLVMLESGAFRIYAICVAILTAKLIYSAVYTGMRRQEAQVYLNPEDAEYFGPEEQAERPDAAPLKRARRIQRNDAETIPAFFAVGLVYVLSGASPFWTFVWCGGFTAARIAHTYAYANALQPMRAAAFGVASACLSVLALIVGWSAIFG